MDESSGNTLKREVSGSPHLSRGETSPDQPYVCPIHGPQPHKRCSLCGGDDLSLLPTSGNSSSNVVAFDGVDIHAIGSEPQFTWRSLLVGGLVGSVITCSNIYFGLRIGWGFGASLFSAILGYSIVQAIGGKHSNFGPKENCTLQTAGAAAGGLSSGFVSAIPAMALLGKEFDYFSLTLWTLCSAYYGLFFAIPLRRHAILGQNLTFPSGTATAETITSMHASKSGESDSMRKAMCLGQTFLATSIYQFVNYFLPFLVDIPLMYMMGLPTIHKWGWELSLSPAFIGGGMLMGFKVTGSFLVGTVIAWGILGPVVYHLGWVDSIYHYDGPEVDDGSVPEAIAHPSAKFWLLWTGVAMMVSEQCVSFLLMYKQIFHALVMPSKSTVVDPVPEEGQVPTKWWATGLAVSSVFTVVTVSVFFDMEWYAAIVSIILAFLFSMIGVQATGETDINPIGSIGKITQFVFAGITPGNPITNIMAANIAGSGAAQTADMMQDLKTGHLLGATPRSQFLAQAAGSLFGVIFTVGTYMLFATAYDIPGPEFQAPAATAWYAVAVVLKDGMDSLPPNSEYGALVGLLVGSAFAVLKAVLPARHKKKMPSMLAFSIAFMVMPSYGVSMFLGSVTLYLWTKRNEQQAKDLMYSVASGMMAGEGVMGVIRAGMDLGGLGEYVVHYPS